MRRILFLCFLLFYSLVFSQIEENPFSNSDNQTYSYSEKTDNQFSQADEATNEYSDYLMRGTGPPGDDDTVPIDNHLALLIIFAIVIIAYHGVKKSTTFEKEQGAKSESY